MTMTKKRKKTVHTIKLVIVILMAVAIAFSALAPVFGETKGSSLEEEIREEVALVIEEIREIGEKMRTLPERYEERRVYVSGVPAGVSFGYDIRERATGQLVRYLQIVLNADPETRVASSGGGSPGNETNYFGPGTRNAVIKFQQKYGISATGFVGSQTRAKINEILQNGLLIKEAIGKDKTEVKERFARVVKKVEEIREKIRALEKWEELEEEEECEDC
jgi:hypothetical protein